MNPKAPAFPNDQHEVHQVRKDKDGNITGGYFENIPQATGLSVRNHIAIEMANGLVSNSSLMERLFKNLVTGEIRSIEETIAKTAYAQADALIAESNKDNVPK